MDFGIYETLMLACFVLLLGHFVVQKVNFFQKFNIPEPVVGGFIVAMFSWIAYSVTGKEFTIDENIQQGMMFISFPLSVLMLILDHLLKEEKD